MGESGTAGGSLAVVDLIKRHGEAVESDLARYYGTDVRELWRRPAPPTRRHPVGAWSHRAAPWLAGLATVLLIIGAVIEPAAVLVLGLALLAAGPSLWARADTAPATAPTLTLTPRRVLALVRHLPEDAATVAAVRGGERFRGWTTDRYLSTLHADLMQNLIYIQAAKANPKRKPPRPEPLPRPDNPPTQAKGKRAGQFTSMAMEHLRAARNAKTRGAP